MRRPQILASTRPHVRLSILPLAPPQRAQVAQAVLEAQEVQEVQEVQEDLEPQDHLLAQPAPVVPRNSLQAPSKQELQI